MREYMNFGREQRSADEMKPWAPLVQIKDHSIPTRDQSTIEARSYRPVDADTKETPSVLLYLHGGGFLTGTVDSEDATCSRLAVNSNVIVLNVCYRHTPEHTYPTAWNDTHDAFGWLHDHIDDLGGDAQRVLVGGISSGAYLAASFCAREAFGPGFCVPPTHCRPNTHGPVFAQHFLLRAYSQEIQRHCRLFSATTLRCAIIAHVYFSDDHSTYFLCLGCLFLYNWSSSSKKLLQIADPREEDLRLNPGYVSASQATGLPPTVVAVAGMDILRDEGLLYAKTLTEAG